MRYGLPYIGSKNAIAEWVVDLLPEADVLCDLFCGGCAITHCALLKNKYKKTIKLEGLTPETKYNYIVFAITEDGDV